MRRFRASLALFCVGLLGCAVAPRILRAQLTGFHAVTGSGFRLIGDAPPQELAALAAELELFQRAFAQLAQRPATIAGAPVPVYLLRDESLARRFGLAGMVDGWMLSTLAGCFASVEVHPNHTQTRGTLFHEYTHVLLRRHRRAPLPPWYDEGLSTYFSTVSIRDGAVVVGSAPGQLITWIEKRGPLPLDRLFEGSVWQLDRREIGDFYATGWALSHYLLATPGGRRELASFATQLERGTAWQLAYASAFDRPLERLGAQLEAHVAMLARGVAAEAMLDGTGMGAPRPPAPAPLRTADVAYELGYLALALRREGEDQSTGALARKLLEISLAEDPSSGRTEAALAETEALRGDIAASLSRTDRALALAPDDPLVRLHVGRVELARAEAAGKGGPAAESALHAAEDQYRRALDLDPASAVAWAGLGQTWRRAGRRDEAIAAFQRARELGWSGQLDLELGGLYLELGRRDEAVALLWPLAQDPHGGQASADARAQLDRAGLLPDEPPAAP